jgi:hypothetical protein
MSGLIWAGIGRGIADAGQTFGNFMAKDIEDRRRATLEAIRDERLSAREEARDIRRVEREAATAEALKKRVAEESVQVESRAADAPIRRDAAAVSRLGAQVEGESPVMEQSEIEKLIRENPQYREVYRKAGLIGEDKMDPRLRAAEDQATSALEIGAHSSVIDAYSKKRRDVLEQIRLENAATRSEQQHTAQMAAINERGRQFDEKKPILQQTADAKTTSAGAAVTRANRPPSSGGGGSGGNTPKVRSTRVDDQGNVVAVMSDGSTKDLGMKSGDYNKSVATMIAKREKDDFQFNKLPEAEKKAWATERLNSGATSPKRGDNQSSTSGATTTTKNYSNLWK